MFCRGRQRPRKKCRDRCPQRSAKRHGYSPHPSKIRDFCHLLPKERRLWVEVLQAPLLAHEIHPYALGMVMVSTIWLSVSRRSDTAGMPESWIRARD